MQSWKMYGWKFGSFHVGIPRLVSIWCPGKMEVDPKPKILPVLCEASSPKSCLPQFAKMSEIRPRIFANNGAVALFF